MAPLNLQVVPGRFAVTKLATSSSIPDWATKGLFTSITRTTEELSIVCPEESVPLDVPSERGFRCLRVAGPLHFSMVGILASLLNPLTEAGVAVFVVSTFDTDILLVRDGEFERSVQALERRGNRVTLSDL